MCLISSGSLGRTFLTVATVALLAGCNGGRFAPEAGISAQSAAQRSAALASPAATLAARDAGRAEAQGLIFAADGGSFEQQNGSFCAYADVDTSRTPLWCQSGGPLGHPAGMTVDPNRNLYVTDGTGFVFEYDAPRASRRPGAPTFTYVDSLGSQGPQMPTAAVVCGSYLYAANNLFWGETTMYFSFTVWKLGDATPLGVMTRPSYVNQGCCSGGSGIVCDSSGNVIFGYNVGFSGPQHYYPGLGGFFDVWSPAVGYTLPAYIQSLAARPRWAQGLAISNKGALIAGEPAYYDYPKAGGLLYLKPDRQNPVHQCSKQVVPPFSMPQAEAFDAGDRHVWVADGGNATLYEIDPKTCEAADTIVTGNGGPFGYLDGVTFSPAQD